MARGDGESDDNDGEGGDAALVQRARALAERYWRLWRANWRPPFNHDDFEEPKA